MLASDSHELGTKVAYALKEKRKVIGANKKIDCTD